MILLETQFWQTLTSFNTDAAVNFLTRAFFGVHNLKSGLHVYFPINLPNHWTCCIVTLRHTKEGQYQAEFYYYDPLEEKTQLEKKVM